MQDTQQSTTRNTIIEIASVMRAHPGATDTEICQFGCFTRRQIDQYGKQAAELAGQQSETRN
ncbi:hypothetical protein [Neorhizobium sp. JUb45]|uniref:hypothetical protein n=1 Tax=Neorhizobium sp. JUb45 TaxID=2485113 RepID=UPI00104ED2B9|nr:hypothetical protein [Neorhizobium sp. JUb45]TCR01088.1 hypothetical protein EDF70_10593 [Neorhizobium sp. JUb45]